MLTLLDEKSQGKCDHTVNNIKDIKAGIVELQEEKYPRDKKLLGRVTLSTHREILTSFHRGLQR